MTDEHADLQLVIDNDWCIGCGVCEMADTSVRVELQPTKLIFEPSSPGGARAASVCPAVGVDFAALHAAVFPDQEVTEYGVVDGVYLAQSTDIDRNMAASSGGLIKELMHALLADPDVDGIITLDHVAGLDFKPRLLDDPGEIDRLPGSVYHNLAQPEALRLLAEHQGRYVLVAIPCHLEGIYQYITRLQPELADRIHTTIGLLCGWQYSHHSLKAIARYKGVDFERISDVAYRGGGPIGKLRLATDDGAERTVSRRLDFDYQVAFDRHFNTPRCHVCIDHSNFLADIVVGDAWLPSTVTSRSGVSLVIGRSRSSRQLLESLVSAGRVVITEVSGDEIRESQTDRVIFGDFAYAYADWLRGQDRFVPDMTGPNRERARLRPVREVERFDRELAKKTELQRQGRYQYLRFRKATLELGRFTRRYLSWFGRKILRVNSLFGHRREVRREQLGGFR